MAITILRSTPLYFFTTSIVMRRKRSRTASSSPQYGRVIWAEEKTARGSRIVGKVAHSPRTPRVKKWATPKKRKLEVSPITLPELEAGYCSSPGPAIPIEFKKSSGKAGFIAWCHFTTTDQTQTTRDMLQEWLPQRDSIISEILDLGAPPASKSCFQCQTQQGRFRCKECFSWALLCRSCCFAAHRNAPFHHIEKWTGKFFDATSLNKEGFVLHLGHHGDVCPERTIGGDGQEAQLGSSDEEEGGKQSSHNLVVVDISGVHQLQISWCHCGTAVDPHLQLLRNRLFPASFKRPSTAFTFAVLDYFHIDAVECKTSASSFFSKLRRLTDGSNPQSIPVSPLLLLKLLQL